MSGRLYSRRQLLRLSPSSPERFDAPKFSRHGLPAALEELERNGLIEYLGATHRKIVVASTPLPVGASCFLMRCPASQNS